MPVKKFRVGGRGVSHDMSTCMSAHRVAAMGMRVANLGWEVRQMKATAYLLRVHHPSFPELSHPRASRGMFFILE